ncbi:MAG: hypothetical protein N2438_06485 [Limisphaera sp.]|nr:hypothetical protein [Limisphaera sp.]
MGPCGFLPLQGTMNYGDPVARGVALGWRIPAPLEPSDGALEVESGSR